MKGLKELLQKLPNELVAILEEEFQSIHSEYALGHWEPSQLNGGRFAEIVFRILEFKQNKNFTPIGTQLDRLKIFQKISQDSNLEDSLRFQVLKLSDLILDFRNKRNVAHLGKIDVNEMDSLIVLSASKWIVAELIRIECNISPEEAQKIIQILIERNVPIIEEINQRLKVLNPGLTVKEKVLLLCYYKNPEYLSRQQLQEWTGYSKKNSGRFKNYLINLDLESLIDYYDDKCLLTKLGIAWVEKNLVLEITLK